MNYDETYSKIDRIIKSLFNETLIKIETIEKRLYGYDFFNDLRLSEYNRFFEETISYLKNNVSKTTNDELLIDKLKKIYKLEDYLPFKEKKMPFLGFIGVLGIGFGYTIGYKEATLEVLKLIKLESENLLYWIKIQM